jgi:hypothetical protein
MALRRRNYWLHRWNVGQELKKNKNTNESEVVFQMKIKIISQNRALGKQKREEEDYLLFHQEHQLTWLVL